MRTNFKGEMTLSEEIKIGDWITCYYAGYWQIVDRKPNYMNGEMAEFFYIVKKGFTPKMKFSLKQEWCAPEWCSRVSREKLQEINEYFAANPEQKRQFDDYSGAMHGVAKGWLIDLPQEEAERYNLLLRDFPEYFSIGQFNRFVEEIGLRKYMYKSSGRAKYMMTIETFPWLVDEKNHNSPIYFLKDGIYLRPGRKDGKS